jgi:hypothetical protein
MIDEEIPTKEAKQDCFLATEDLNMVLCYKWGGGLGIGPPYEDVQTQRSRVFEFGQAREGCHEKKLEVKHKREEKKREREEQAKEARKKMKTITYTASAR